MLTAQMVGDLVSTGLRYWWFRQQTFFATDSRDPQVDDDLYILDTVGWVEQWDGNWQAAADQLNPFMDRLPGASNPDEEGTADG